MFMFHLCQVCFAHSGVPLPHRVLQSALRARLFLQVQHRGHALQPRHRCVCQTAGGRGQAADIRPQGEYFVLFMWQ